MAGAAAASIGLPAVPAFDALLLPESLRPWVVDIADRAQAPLDFPAAGAIVGLSSVLGRRLGIKPKRQDDWLVVPNLWGLIVGPPGFLKSPMLREVLKPLTRLETEAGDEYKAARVEFEFQEAAMTAQRKKILAKGADRDEMVIALRELQADAPVQRRYVVNDPTVEKIGGDSQREPAGVLLFRDAIAALPRWNVLATRMTAPSTWKAGTALAATPTTVLVAEPCISRPRVSHCSAALLPVRCARTCAKLSLEQRRRSDSTLPACVYPDAPTTWSNIDRSPDRRARPARLRFSSGSPALVVVLSVLSVTPKGMKSQVYTSRLMRGLFRCVARESRRESANPTSIR